MIVHPVVSEQGELIEDYPIITTREAQTQILMRSGETIMIGGLIKDVRSKGVTGVPILKDIPLLGWFFRRTTDDVQKVELLIFITAHIVDEKTLASEQLTEIQKRMTPLASEF
jgi:type IV pilus assembly protein PilQ